MGLFTSLRALLPVETLYPLIIGNAEWKLLHDPECMIHDQAMRIVKCRRLTG
jgi:hypothetical protein